MRLSAAALISCLLLLRLFGALAPAVEAGFSDHGATIALEPGRACQKASSVGHAPDAPSSHIDCCAFCAPNARDAGPPALILVALVCSLLFEEPELLIAVPPGRRAAELRSVGFASSWAGRAPPLFS